MSFEKHPTENDSDKESHLEEVAVDVGLKDVELPHNGTIAYERLEKLCREYSNIVHEELTSKNIRTNPNRLHESEKTRRSLHNQLCIMLYGTNWQDTESERVQKASEFAHLVSRRDFLLKDKDPYDD